MHTGFFTLLWIMTRKPDDSSRGMKNDVHNFYFCIMNHEKISMEKHAKEDDWMHIYQIMI